MAPGGTARHRVAPQGAAQPQPCSSCLSFCCLRAPRCCWVGMGGGFLVPKHSSGSASRRSASKFLQNFCSLWHKSKGKASVVLLVLLAVSHPLHLCPVPAALLGRGRGGDVGRFGAEVPNHEHGTCPCAPRGILGAAACREQLLAPCTRKILHFTPPARRGEVISRHGGVGGFPICWAPALPCWGFLRGPGARGAGLQLRSVLGAAVGSSSVQPPLLPGEGGVLLSGPFWAQSRARGAAGCVNFRLCRFWGWGELVVGMAETGRERAAV